MNTTVINIRTQPATKKAAQDVAKNLGMPLSVLINGFLKQLVKTKSYSIKTSGKPTPYLLKTLKESQKEILQKKTSPLYRKSDEAITWLHDKSRKYEHQIHKKVR